MKKQVARALGYQATVNQRVQTFGKFKRPVFNATDAREQRSANGIGPRSVWDGPKSSRQPGAPILRRVRLA
jgi:hypothetical protein